MRLLLLFAALVILLGCGAAVLAWPRGASDPALRAQIQSSDYRHLRPGVTPASDLSRLGFDTRNAVRLSYLGVVEQFMPGDSFGFDTLDPAVQSCFEARDRCIAYFFPLADRPGMRAVVMIEDGRVVYKSIAGRLLTADTARLKAAEN